MQFEEGLAFVLSSLAKGVRLTATQLEFAARRTPDPPTPFGQTLLHLLLVAHRASADSLPAVEVLGLLLPILAQRLGLRRPLSLLAGCDGGLQEYWAQLPEGELKRAVQWAFGVFPSGSNRSVFAPKEAGNAQWVYARQALRDSLRMRGGKMEESSVEVHQFLLADVGLLELWSSPLRHVWVRLYLAYNSLVLAPALRESGVAETDPAVSWCRPSVAETVGELRRLQEKVSSEERVMLLVSLAALAGSTAWQEELGEGLLQAALAAHLQTCDESSSWQNVMALLLFSESGRAGGVVGVDEACGREFRRLLGQGPLQRLASFLYFFLPEPELQQVVLAGSLEFWRLPMPEQMRRRTALFMLEHGRLSLHTLKLVPREQLHKGIFCSGVLGEAAGEGLVCRLGELEGEVLKALGWWGMEAEAAVANYRLFTRTWEGYYGLLVAGTLEQAENALAGHSGFHPSLSLRLPRDCPSELLTVLLFFVRAFRAKSEYLSEQPVLRFRLQALQEMLPGLLGGLSAEQRGEFDRQWAEVTALVLT